MPNPHHVIEIDSILKSFGHYQLLTDVYLKCETKDIIAVLGRNGSGKSTLLKIMFGTMAADRKFIRYNYEKVLNKPFKQSELISYLPQDPFLPKMFKVDTIARSHLSEKNYQLFFEGDEIALQFRGDKVSNLSDGIKRYLEVKLLLLNESKFLLLDEPFKFMSPVMVEDVLTQIQKSSENKGIIITDHQYDYTMSIATKVFLLNDGALKEVPDNSDLIELGYLPKQR